MGKSGPYTLTSATTYTENEKCRLKLKPTPSTATTKIANEMNLRDVARQQMSQMKQSRLTYSYMERRTVVSFMGEIESTFGIF